MNMIFLFFELFHLLFYLCHTEFHSAPCASRLDLPGKYRAAITKIQLELACQRFTSTPSQSLASPDDELTVTLPNPSNRNSTET
jgi:hypothetical protein